MVKKYTVLAMSCLALIALTPGFSFAKTVNRDNDYNNRHTSSNNTSRDTYRDNGSYYERDKRFLNYEDLGGNRARHSNNNNYNSDFGNSYSYSNYTDRSYYTSGNYNYCSNYNYNNNCNCNCGCNYQGVPNYYDPTPGATNYTRPIVGNCGCQAQYYNNYNGNYYRYN